MTYSKETMERMEESIRAARLAMGGISTAAETASEAMDALNEAGIIDWYVDGHYILADSADDARAQVKRLYLHDAEIVRPWSDDDLDIEDRMIGL